MLYKYLILWIVTVSSPALGATLLEMPYENSNISMLIILPDLAVKESNLLYAGYPALRSGKISNLILYIMLVILPDLAVK